MDAILLLVASLALDLFSEAKMPCWTVGFDYFTRITIAIVAPAAFALVCYIGGVIYQVCRPHSVRKSRAQLRASVKRRAEKHHIYSNNPLKAGLWTALPYVLFTVDIFHPTITKTLCSYFTCRDLGAAGSWLEQEHVFVVATYSHASYSSNA